MKDEMTDEISAVTEATFAILRILDAGARKYPAGHFRTLPALKHAEAAERHLRAWMMGQRLDAETGLPSLWHVAARIVFALALEAWAERAEQPGKGASQ